MLNEIYRRFDDWKRIDRFYFIPLQREMTYTIDGHRISLADEPLYLGTFIRNTLRHPDLFTAPCPQCSRRLLPHSYNGSPLSGRVDLQVSCPQCGRDHAVTVSGWHVRSQALRAAQRDDRPRLLKAKLLHPGFKPATIQELQEWLE